MIEYPKRFYEFIEEETKREMKLNKRDSNISRQDLIDWSKELNMNKKYLSKEDIIKSILESGQSYLDFFNRFNNKAYGIHPSRFSNKFKINNYQRHKMQEQGFIKMLYIKEEEIYPTRFEKVPYYDPVRYFSISQNDIEEWKSVNIKGYINKNQCSLFD